jgi:hypothetical protein
MHQFKAKLEIIGINPFVFVPDDILQQVFSQAKKNKGAIPIKGKVNGVPYKQNLVKYSGYWRLYVNMIMLKNSPKRIGETIEVTVEFDPSDRTIQPHPMFLQALDENQEAKEVFESLAPSLKLEIVRYIANLKTEASIERNVKKAIQFLLGNERFVGRNVRGDS